MATFTSFLNLEKPTTSERLDVLKINSNWDKIDAGVSALNTKVTAKYTNLGSYAHTQTNAWENTGVTITVPDGHNYIGVLISGYTSGRPLGIGVDRTQNPPGGMIEQSAESSNGQYSVFVLLYPGTWYVFTKRATASTAPNSYYFRYYDMG